MGGLEIAPPTLTRNFEASLVPALTFIQFVGVIRAAFRQDPISWPFTNLHNKCHA